MNTLLLAAGWRPLIPFAVFFGFLALSLLHTLWKRSQRGDSDNPGGWRELPEPLEEGTVVEGRAVVGRYIRPNASTAPPAPPLLPRTPRPLSPWEQELERVLRREVATIPAPPLPVAPLPDPPPPPYDSAGWQMIPIGLSVEELVATDLESAPMPETPLASLEPADSAYNAAAGLQERVRNFMKQVDSGVDRAIPSVPKRRAARSPQMEAFVTGFRTPATARQAMLASLVLGRPKAFER